MGKGVSMRVLIGSRPVVCYKEELQLAYHEG